MLEEIPNSRSSKKARFSDSMYAPLQATWYQQGYWKTSIAEKTDGRFSRFYSDSLLVTIVQPGERVAHLTEEAVLRAKNIVKNHCSEDTFILNAMNRYISVHPRNMPADQGGKATVAAATVDQGNPTAVASTTTANQRNNMTQ